MQSTHPIDSHQACAFSVAEVLTTRLPMSRATLYALINSGELQSFKIGRRRYVSARALADFIAHREAQS